MMLAFIFNLIIQQEECGGSARIILIKSNKTIDLDQVVGRWFFEGDYSPKAGLIVIYAERGGT